MHDATGNGAGLSTGSTAWDRDAALTTARLLLEIKAVNFRPDEPYTLTSGWKSPVYIDCRRIIFFPRARQKIMELGSRRSVAMSGMKASTRWSAGKRRGFPSPHGLPTA